MKKLFYILLFFLTFISFNLIAQEKKKSPAGFGIEAGVGYNSMDIIVLSNTGVDSTVTMNHFWLQPSLRLHYDIRMTAIGLKNNLLLKTLLGYYTFGGKLNPDNYGNSIVIALGSIEAGAGLAFDFNHLFQITPMIKGQYIFSASERFIQVTSKTPIDIKKDFKNFSSNAGLQLRFKYKHFTFGAEGWFGLTSFHKAEIHSAKEKNYRLMIGYEF